MGINKTVDINTVMGDLEYLIRDGLGDPRSLTPKGLRTITKILRDVYTLLERGKEYKIGRAHV